MTLERKWVELSGEEKREDRFRNWLSPKNVKFSSPETEKGYKDRVTRFIKAIKLEEPDRVPVMLPSGYYPAIHGGSSLKKVMYDYDELRRTYLKFLEDFDMDSYVGPSLVLPGKLMEDIDYKLHEWPGHGLGDDVTMYQYVEGEYMAPEEYDELMEDPTDFLLRRYLPRCAGAFAGLGKLPPLTPLVAIPVYYMLAFADPEVRASVQALLDGAVEGAKWWAAVSDVNTASLSAGIPSVWGGLACAPYDLIGDSLRGTKGIMMDMYRRPSKLIEAMERLVPIAIKETVAGANASGCPIVFMPLHKGTGGFMSNQQFERFYWPTLRKLLLGLIDEGLVPMGFAEGDYTDRLDIIKEMPKGSMIWYFETMDMGRAKKTLGSTACIAGNLPTSILCTGTPSRVEDYCQKLIETCAPGGGYILSGAASMDKGDPNNLRAMMTSAKKYGTYSR
jgi:uroporphyrinogen-III decarboxylase